MAKFKIYSPAGTEIYEGTPTFTGQYRKPGMLEFRNVGVPTYIDFSPGCYVGYESGGSIVPQYPRTGFGYKIYTVPQVKKQARSGSYGGAFEYQSIQLYDASKELEYCPFRDIVKGDNRIHFSTQPSISTFEGVDGLARRFEACLQDQYGANSWRVRIATTTDGISQDLADLMADAREFTVSGMNILECLDKIYDIWPEVGWIYTMETVGGRPTNTIIIGGAGLNPNQGTYAYGKGNGLKSLTRTVANADELANRIFAYGSQRNMTSDWYRSKTIKDAASVDIKHLMIPTSHWGETDGLPDAAKAFVDDGYSIARRGLRPRTAYFDGTEDLPEIYPTIEGMTIADVLGAAPDYVPNTTTIYRDPTHTRVDELNDAEEFEDDGYSGSSGQSRLLSRHFDVPAVNATAVAGAESEEYTFDVFSSEIEGRGIGVDIEATIDFAGVLTVQSATRVWTRLEITTGSDDELRVFAETEIVGAETEPGSGVWNVTGGQVSLGGQNFPLNKDITVSAKVFAALAPLEEVEPEEEEEEPVVPTSRDISINTVKGSGHIYETTHRKKTFHITLRQVGFDIAAQGDLGDGKVISMRSGKCQGRSFAIKDAILDIEHDTWDLECYRSEDESVGQWFPNAMYPVEEGDRFVLLDIAMPDSYINVAENRLYSAAQSLLSDTATERWQYIPEIDAKYMVENSHSIRAGENMTIVGVDIVEGEEGFVYLTESTGSNLQTTDGKNLILDGSGYRISMMVDTVVIAEGESTIPTYKVTLLDRKRKVFTESKSVSEYTARSVANARQIETSKITSESSFFELCDDNSVKLKDKYIGLWVGGWMAAGGVAGESEGGGGGTSFLWQLDDVDVTTRANGDLLSWNGADWVNIPRSDLLSNYYTKLQIDSLLSNFDIDGLLESITTQGDGTLDFTWHNGEVTKVDLSHRHPDLESAIASLRVWIDDGQGNLTLDTTKYSNVWVPGWMAAGGIGSSSSGGVSFLKELTDIYHSDTGILRADGTSVQNGDVLVYDSVNGRWSAAAQSGGSIGSTVSWGTESDGAVSLTVNGATKTLLLSEALSGYATTAQLSGYLPLTGGTLSGDLRLKNSSDYGMALYFGDGTYAYIAELTDDVLTIYGRNGLSLSAGASSSKLEWDSENSAWHFYGNVYADGWMAAGGIGSSSSGGSSVTISNLLSSGTRIATITVDGTGYDILAPSGGSGGSSVAWGTQSGNAIPLTVNGTVKSLLVSEADPTVPSWAKQDSLQFSDLPSLYVGTTAIRSTSESQGLTGISSIKLSSSASLFEWDSENSAWHFYGNVYADGWMSAGGIGDGALDDTVTQDSSRPVKSSGIYSFVTSRRWSGSQAQYDALGTYDDNVEYLITES